MMVVIVDGDPGDLKDMPAEAAVGSTFHVMESRPRPTLPESVQPEAQNFWLST
ncbi:hypothetical protein BLSMQ_3274 [Brevibacterium aurantiacum]|uniref:Uncharacterized protein n=1 Tax=Brevibacterium aurantiacum TaxID=273384 RepID=A0A1D7W7M3_BREAU|nr:hypothetical protein BLSMQ_3274 [Brevibacterium aurantiacum]